MSEDARGPEGRWKLPKLGFLELLLQGLGLLDTSGWLYAASSIQLTANGRGVGSFALRERDYVASENTSDETASQRVPLTAYGSHQRVHDQCVQRGTTRQLLLEAASAVQSMPAHLLEYSG